MSRERSGKITSLILDGIESLEAFFARYVPQVVTVLLSGCFVVVYLWQFDPAGSVVLLLSMVLCVVLPLITVPLISRNVTNYWTEYSALTSEYIDTIQGITTIKTLNAEKTKGRDLLSKAQSFYKRSVRNTGISLINSAVMLVLSGITSSLVVVYVAWHVKSGVAESAAVTAFLFLAVECARPMLELNRAWHSSFLGFSVVNELFTILNTEPSIKQKHYADASSLDNIVPEVTLENVTFTYPEGSQAADHVSLTVESGMTAAIVGRSGSGKTTLLKLLMRLYDPTEGRILINHKDIRDYDLKYLYEKTAVVFQDSFLFYGTIAENIRLGKPNATDEEVRQAAIAANADVFINALPDKYDTIVGERGMTLSGGERQRISIARAVLKNAPLLLLDEATSSVDIAAEQSIRDALHRLMKNRTTILVAHRLASIEHAEKIFVMDHGKLVEEGTNEELLDAKGRYYNLVKAQKEAER